MEQLTERNVLSEQGQELLVVDALPLIRELRQVLTQIAKTEPERRGLVRKSLVAIGKTSMALAAAGRFSAGLAGLATAPSVISNGARLVESIAEHVG